MRPVCKILDKTPLNVYNIFAKIFYTPPKGKKEDLDYET